MDTCQWADCKIPIQQPSNGRPRKYCDTHAAESKRRSNKRWRKRQHAGPVTPPGQRRHFVALIDEHGNDPSAEHAGATGDKYFHPSAFRKPPIG